MDEAPPPPLTPEEILWIRRTREGQRAVSLVMGYAKLFGLWVAGVAGGLGVLLNLVSWFKGHSP